MTNTELPPMPDFMPGTVWLAGAGPGDPGLLTLLTMHGLRCADVVVYDALVNKRILTFARSGAGLIYAGKRGGRPSSHQRDISQRLVELASAGNRVLRLKGGDPFVFGRGGEEAFSLVKAGVSFRIIPGITAGIGGLAYAGIPVTNRDTNSAVTFITGHGVTGSMPEDLDWDALARGAPVLIFYMALTQLPKIAQCLIEAGRKAEEPVAIVSCASTPEQTIVETTLNACESTVYEVKPPAIIAVGPVVKLRSVLDWFVAGEDLPLQPNQKRAKSELVLPD